MDVKVELLFFFVLMGDPLVNVILVGIHDHH